jgi:hypothetical protein
VPWLRSSGDRSIVFGELGRDALTGCYLTFNGRDLAGEAALQPPGWETSAAGLSGAPGRFGGGARLEARSQIRVALPAEPPVWSIEFWVWPEELGNHELLELPGVLHAYANAAGRIFTEVPGAGDVPDAAGVYPALVVGSKATLVARAWNHVGIVLDLAELRAVRLVVNGEVTGRRFDLARVTARPRELAFGDARANGKGPACVIDELRVQHRNLSSAEILEHGAARARAVEPLVLGYGDGTVARHALWSEAVATPRLAGAEDWARGELVHARASPAGLAWSSEHWRRARTVTQPLPRTTHPTVSLGGGRAFLFGGETRDTHYGRIVNTDDTWIFDAPREEWSRVTGAPRPSPRCHMPAAYSPDHDLVLLVGGWWNEANPGRLLADAWEFHVAERRWERTRLAPTLDESSDHGLVYLPARRSFLLLRAEDAWLYDPEARRWSHQRTRAVDARGEPVAFSLGASPTCALDPRSGMVVVFGSELQGETSTFLDTTALYDVERATYTLLDLPLRPAGRVRPAFAYDPVRARFVLFGGVRSQEGARYDDLWVFDPQGPAWREIPRGPARPSARGGYYGMAYDEIGDRFVVPQGRHSLERWQSETWFLELDERRPGRARYLFDRAAFAERSWFAEVEAPGRSAVRFRFRASEERLTSGDWSSEIPGEGRFLEVEVELLPDGDGRGPRVTAMGFRGDSGPVRAVLEASARGIEGGN